MVIVWTYGKNPNARFYKPPSGLLLSFEAPVVCKVSPVAVKYVANGHVQKARKSLSI